MKHENENEDDEFFKFLSSNATKLPLYLFCYLIRFYVLTIILLRSKLSTVAVL